MEYYKTTSKNSPVEEFIDELEVKAQIKVFDTIGLLKEYGISLSLPHVKKVVGTTLWELRIVGQDSIRIFYVTHTGKVFLFLYGFQKKKQKTDKKEINIALKRLVEYQSKDQN
ncbi:type II toxin-antitoxin system RelE/ParE family toxin [Candidatus Daviesbacteria bacterium]|nr:type II toxin-antitoxin system RelE/ParE family toxin [Candidatus Daviesbacteria bacterium]